MDEACGRARSADRGPGERSALRNGSETAEIRPRRECGELNTPGGARCPMLGAMIKNRRRHPRLQIPLEAEYLVEGAKQWRQGTIQSLGAGGAGVLCEEDLPKGTTLAGLRFVVEAEGDLPETRFEVAAVVVHGKRQPDVGRAESYYLGLQFSDLEDQQFELLRQFVFKRLTEDEASSSGADGGRQRIDTPIAIRFKRFDDFVEEVSENLSPTGMFIRTSKPLPLGAEFAFEFQLRDEFALFKGTAEVVWTRRRSEGTDRPPGMGVRFLKLDLTSQKVVRRIVEQRAESTQQSDPSATSEAGVEADSGDAPKASQAAEPFAQVVETEAPVAPPVVDAGAASGKKSPPGEAEAEAGGNPKHAAAEEAKLRHRLERLEERLGEARSARDKLQGRFNRIFDEVETLRQKISRLEAAREKAETERDGARAEAADAREALAAREKELLAELEAARQSAAKQSADVDRKQAKSLKKAQAKLEAELQDLEQDAERKRQAWEAREAELKSRLEESSASEKELQGRLDAALSAEAELQEHLKEAQAAREELEQQLERSVATEAELEAELQKAKEESECLQKDWGEQVADFRAKLKRKSAAEEEFLEQLETANGARAEVQQRLEQAEGLRDDLEQRLEEIQGAHDELEQRLDRSATAESELRDRVGELARSLSASQSEREALSRRLEATAAERDALREQVDALMAARQGMQETLQRAGDEVRRFRSLAEALETELGNELGGIQAIDVGLQEKLEEATKARVELDEQLGSVNAVVVEALEAPEPPPESDPEPADDLAQTEESPEAAAAERERVQQWLSELGVEGEEPGEREPPGAGEDEPREMEPPETGPPSPPPAGIVGVARRAMARLGFGRPAANGGGTALERATIPVDEVEAIAAAAGEEPAHASSSGPDGDGQVAGEPDLSELEETVRAWAAAWSEQRVSDYLAFYSREFKPSRGGNGGSSDRRTWVPPVSGTELTLGPISQQAVAPGRVNVSFEQSVETDSYTRRVGRALELVWEGGGWKIAAESFQDDPA